MRENLTSGSMRGGWNRNRGPGDLCAGRELPGNARRPDGTAPAAYSTETDRPTARRGSGRASSPSTAINLGSIGRMTRV